MKLHTIIVLSDGETWTTIDGCSICVVDDDTMEELKEGYKPRWVNTLVEIALTECGIPHDRSV